MSLATTVTISNVLPRVDVGLDRMDAHDGSYNQLEDGSWVYHAMGYGECKQGGDQCNGDCGYGYSQIGVWTSPTLANATWTLAAEDARDDSWPRDVKAYFRVHALERDDGKWVLWANLDECPESWGGSANCYGVGIADSAEGPFAFAGIAHTTQSGNGDFDLFVDDDKQAYLIFTARDSCADSHCVSVERLTDNYLNSTLESSGVFGESFVEAPAMFKREGVYYSLFGKCCCFCSEGSGIQVYTSTEGPMGPWSFQKNIGCATQPASGCGCGMASDPNTCADLYGQSVTQAQQNYVIRVPAADGSTTFVWTGDRWESSDDGLKAHDLQYWSPLVWSDTSSDGLPLPAQFEWLDSFELEVA